MDTEKILSLTEEEINEIKDELDEGYAGNYENGCLCGYYEFYIENIGFITIETHCRKSNSCPSGMSWYVNDSIPVWGNTVCEYGYVPTEDEAKEDELELLGYLDKTSSQKLKELIREEIIEYHSWSRTDEYGNQADNTGECINDEVDTCDHHYDYQKAYEYVITYLVNLEASCSNCGSNKECCEDCKNGKQMWTFNHQLIDGIEKFKVK